MRRLVVNDVGPEITTESIERIAIVCRQRSALGEF